MWARLLLVSIGLLGSTAVAQGQSAPVCKAPTSRISEPDRKFHPGHYVAIGKVEGAKGITKAANKGVTGVQLRYRWANLEPEEDRYDFSAIARDLATAKRAGLQLVVMVEDKSFDYEVPTPAYLQDKHTVATRNRGFTAVRWDPFVNDRFRQLVAKLGAQFDCDPHFEGVAFQESSPSLDSSALAATGYSPEKYRDALVGLLRSAAASVPRSRVFWYMNFLPGRQDYIGDIASALSGSGVVLGGPDVLPENPALARRVYPFYEKFRGRLKLFGSMQHDSYRHRRSNAGGDQSPYWSMEDMFLFARDRLHVDYLFWEYRTKRQPPDSRDWNDAREVIARYPTF